MISVTLMDCAGMISFEEFHMEFWQEQQPNRTFEYWAASVGSNGTSTGSIGVSNISNWEALVDHQVSRAHWQQILEAFTGSPSLRYAHWFLPTPF